MADVMYTIGANAVSWRGLSRATCAISARKIINRNAQHRLLAFVPFVLRQATLYCFPASIEARRGLFLEAEACGHSFPDLSICVGCCWGCLEGLASDPLIQGDVSSRQLYNKLLWGFWQHLQNWHTKFRAISPLRDCTMTAMASLQTTRGALL